MENISLMYDIYPNKGFVFLSCSLRLALVSFLAACVCTVRARVFLRQRRYSKLSNLLSKTEYVSF